MKLAALILSTIILFGVPDMGYSQLKLPSLQRLKEITKKVQHRGKKSGRIARWRHAVENNVEIITALLR